MADREKVAPLVMEAAQRIVPFLVNLTELSLEHLHMNPEVPPTSIFEPLFPRLIVFVAEDVYDESQIAALNPSRLEVLQALWDPRNGRKEKSPAHLCDFICGRQWPRLTYLGLDGYWFPTLFIHLKTAAPNLETLAIEPQQFDPNAPIDEGDFPRYLAENDNDKSLMELLKQPNFESLQINGEFTWPDLLRDLAPTQQLKLSSRQEEIDREVWEQFIEWALQNAPEIVTKIAVRNGTLWSYFCAIFIQPNGDLPSRRFVNEFFECMLRSSMFRSALAVKSSLLRGVETGQLLSTKERFSTLRVAVMGLCFLATRQCLDERRGLLRLVRIWFQMAIHAIEYEKPDIFDYSKNNLALLLPRHHVKMPAATLCSLKPFFEPSVWRKTVFAFIKDPDWCASSCVSIDLPVTPKTEQQAGSLLVPLVEHFEEDPQLMAQVLKLPHFSYSARRSCPLNSCFVIYLLFNLTVSSTSPSAQEIDPLHECFRFILDSFPAQDLNLLGPVPEILPAQLSNFLERNSSYREKYELLCQNRSLQSVWKFLEHHVKGMSIEAAATEVESLITRHQSGEVDLVELIRKSSPQS